jgi:hypothetical protein
MRVHENEKPATIQAMAAKKKKKAEKALIGRPPIGKEALTEDLHIRVETGEKDLLARWCEKNKMSKTDAVRAGLRMLGALK